MPLEKAPVGSPGFSRNVETEVKAGKPVPQAVAIAYKMSGERQDASPIYEENGEFFFPKPGSMERYGPYASKAEATSAAAKAGVVSDAERDLMGESTGDDEAILGRKDAGGKYLVTKQFIGGNLNGITIKDPSPVSFEVGKTYGGGGYTGPKFKVVACSRMDSVKADADPYVVMRFQNNPSARGFVVSVNEFVKKDELGRLHFRKIDGGEAGTKKAAEAIYDKLKAKYASRIKAASADRADATPTIREENGQWVITIDEGTNTSIFRLDVREYPTKAEALEYALSNPQYTNRKDSLPPLDRALAAADSLYAKALKTAHKDAERDLPGSSTTEGNYGIDAE